ncbi:MAG: Gfo/Idh/MocA family protein [Pirellulales bacterium]
MTQRLTRRSFIKTSAATSAVLAIAHVNPTRADDSKSPNEKLNIACVGVANKGRHNIDQLTSENIAFLCDVDENLLNGAAETFKGAKHYRDFRRLLDAEEKNIDAVVVSTADHTHAPATAAALVRGKHVYCEKPLTHSVHEARHIAELAKKHKVATQMGTQVHAEQNYRRVVELVQSGVIGPVREVYNWCNKGWSNGRFADAAPAPANLDWDLWLGPAAERPYSAGIHPGNWRRFWEYGSGTFGDMACHVMDLPFWALDLRHPTSVTAKGPEIHPDGAPEYCLCDYEFPARGDRPALKFYWSDGGHHHEKVRNTNDASGQPLSNWGLGVLFVGDKGMLAADYGRRQLLPVDSFAGVAAPPESIPNSIGHWREWIEACKTGSPTTCNFDYSGALTETVLLGVVAFRAGEPLAWDAANLKVTNSTAGDNLIRKEYRKGWELAGT